MNMTGNTLLITGGSGIGLVLAEEFFKLDNRVIVAGRTLETLKVADQKGLKTFSIDISDSPQLCPPKKPGNLP